MAAAESMRAAQGNDLAVVKTHAPKDGAEMRLLFRAVGKTAVRSAHGDVAISSAGPPGNDRSLHFLYGADAGEGPEVGVGYPGELLCQNCQLLYYI